MSYTRPQLAHVHRSPYADPPLGATVAAQRDRRLLHRALSSPILTARPQGSRHARPAAGMCESFAWRAGRWRNPRLTLQSVWGFIPIFPLPDSSGFNGEGAHGCCFGRGTRAPQDDQLVRRVRCRSREPELPDHRAGRLGALAGRLGGRDPVDGFRPARRASQLHLFRDGGDVPEAVGRHRDLRARGVETVLLVHRTGRRVRVLDRLVGGALGDRRRRRILRPGRVVHRPRRRRPAGTTAGRSSARPSTSTSRSR